MPSLWKQPPSSDASDDTFAMSGNRTRSPSPPAEDRQWTNTSVALTTVASITAAYYLRRFYKRYLRRVPNISHLHPDALRNRSLFGYVTRVGDGDNFRFFHTPLGRFAGWGWFPGRQVQSWSKKELQDQTLHVRIAGVDAPECAHFGRPAQPHSTESLEMLKSKVEGRWVRVYPLRKDQYERVVSRITVGVLKSDLGTWMIRNGTATVYEAKFGSEFAGLEDVYRNAEEQARKSGKGMWNNTPGLVGRLLGQQEKARESPREYKTRMKLEDQAK